MDIFYSWNVLHVMYVKEGFDLMFQLLMISWAHNLTVHFKILSFHKRGDTTAWRVVSDVREADMFLGRKWSRKPIRRVHGSMARRHVYFLHVSHLEHLSVWIQSIVTPAWMCWGGLWRPQMVKPPEKVQFLYFKTQVLFGETEPHTCL